MSTTILDISSLTKRFKSVTAVNQLNLQVKKGQVFGILGPNGSGKTTTLAMVLGVIYPTSGSYSWFGQGADHMARRRIGALLETPNFYPGHSGRRNLEIMASVKGLDHADIDGVLRTVGLLERAGSSFKSYSLGMKQRLAIGATLLGNPEVLVLDEPTNGLDPQGIAEIRTLIRDLSAKGITIILASHLLDEVQRVCTNVCIIKRGNLLYTGKLLEADSHSYFAEMQAVDTEQLRKACNEFSGLQKLTADGGKVVAQLSAASPVADFHRFLIGRGIVLTHLHTYTVDLENKYLEIINEKK